MFSNPLVVHSTANRGAVLAAPLSNVSDYRVLRDNIGDSLKDITVTCQCGPPTGAGPATST